MDQNSIEVFITVAEEGSFRKAANKLGYTQAGISYIVQSMEQETGLLLFNRDRTGVKLSPEGKQLLPQMKLVNHENRVLNQMIHELNSMNSGTLRVLVFDSVSIHWLPGILHEFKRDFPGIRVDIVLEEDAHKAEKMVLSREVDCGFFLSDVTAPLEVFPLKEESLKAIISPEHELAHADSFPLEKLGEYPFIQLKFDTNTGINGIFNRNGVKANIAYTVDSDFAAMALVSKGLGFGIYPELLLKNVPVDVVQLDFDIPQKRTISVGTKSMESSSLAVRKFIEYTRRWVSQNVE